MTLAHWLRYLSPGLQENGSLILGEQNRNGWINWLSSHCNTHVWDSHKCFIKIWPLLRCFLEAGSQSWKDGSSTKNKAFKWSHSLIQDVKWTNHIISNSRLLKHRTEIGQCLTINQDTPTEESKEVKKLSLPQQLVAIYKYQLIWWRNIATTTKDLQKACQMKICSLFSPNNKGSS